MSNRAVRMRGLYFRGRAFGICCGATGMSTANLQQGDRVSFVDDVGGGVVLRSGRPGHVIVRTDDGFELEQPVQQLVLVPESARAAHMRLSEHQLGMVRANDEMAERRKKRTAARPGKTPKKQEDNSVAEVDLHLHDHGSATACLKWAGKSVTVTTQDDMTRWVVWTQAGKDFVCLEPWTSPGNALNTGERLIVLGPGEVKSLTTKIAFTR